MSENAIVTKNDSLIAWLQEKGIKGDIYDYVTPGDIAHKHVYGIVPYWMAAFAECITEVSMPGLDRSGRDRFNRGEITVQEMDAAGAELVTYRVRRV